MVESNQSVNAIIAQALENAGVQTKDIELPSEVVAEQVNTVPSLDGLPKGQTKGSELDVPEVKSEVAETPESSKPEPDAPTGTLLSKADMEAAVTEATSKFQSIMDKKINAINFQMQQTVGALNQFFQTQDDNNLANLPADEQVNKRLELLEKGGRQPRIQIQPQPINEQPAQYYQQLVNFVDTVGLKIDDKRIDWAPDTDNPQVGMSRFMASIKTALLADQTALVKNLRAEGEREIGKMRKKVGLDKVSTNGPSGAGTPDVSKMSAIQKIQYGVEQEALLSQVSK